MPPSTALYLGIVRFTPFSLTVRAGRRALLVFFARLLHALTAPVSGIDAWPEDRASRGLTEPDRPLATDSEIAHQWG